MASILFVDDDPLTLETLKRSVELFGHEALLANSAEQAQDLAANHQPDLILTDMNLPDMDGVSLVRALKATPGIAEIPIIMLSASPELDVSDIALTAGAEEYLSKPIRLQILQDVIARYTGD
ncbi:MAG: response regulator [Chloroflexota bacterium]|nr:MAG: response regulator [Chloroflexota bacterium]